MTELGEGSEDSRRRVAVGELVPEGDAAGPVEALLHRLAEERLVTLDDGSAEVAHEALIREWPQLRRWLDEDRAGIRAHQQLGDAARLWDAGGREPSDLYRGARLVAALELVESRRDQLNATERAFLDAAAEEADRERRAERRTNRRLRALLAGGAVLLVVALLGGVLAIFSRNTAQDAERAAEAQALTADAQRIGALSRAAPTLAQTMLYAAAAVEVEDTVETRGDLLAALQRNWAAVRSLPLSSASLTGAAVSRGLLASTDAAGVVRFIDLRTWAPSGAPVKLGRRIDWGTVAFSPDGGTLAVMTRQDGRAEVHLIDVESRATRRIGSWGGLGPFDNEGGRRRSRTPRTVAGSPSCWRRCGLGVPGRPRSAYSSWTRGADARCGSAGTRSRDGQWRPTRSSSPAAGSSPPPSRARPWCGTRAPDASCAAIRSAARSPSRPIAGGSPSPATALPGPIMSSSITVLHLRTGKQRDLDSRLNDSWIGGLAYTGDGKRIVVGGRHDHGVGRRLRGHRGDVRHDRSARVAGRRRAGPPRARVGQPVRRHHDRLGPGGDAAGRAPVLLRSESDGCVLPSLLRGRSAGRRDGVEPRRRHRDADRPARQAPHRGPSRARRDVGGGDGLHAGRPAARDRRQRGHRHDPRRPLARGRAPAALPGTGRHGGVLARRQAARGAAQARGGGRVDGRGPRAALEHTRVRQDGRRRVPASWRSRATAVSSSPRRAATVVAWDARSGEQRLRVPAADRAHAFALSPDSRVVAAGSAGGRVRLWDLRTGRPRGAATKVAGADIFQLAISPDGRLLAVGAFDGTAAVWDLRTRTRLGESFTVVTGLAPAVAFKPDGRLIVGEYMSAIEWPLDRPTLQRFACRIAGRDMTRAEWEDVLPNQPFRRVCG